MHRARNTRSRVDEQAGLAQGQDLAQGVGPCPGNQHVRAGEGVGHAVAEILHLAIALALQAFVQVAPAAEVQHLEVRQQKGQGLPQRLVDGLGAGAAARDQQNGFFALQAEAGEPPLPGAGKQLIPQGACRCSGPFSEPWRSRESWCRPAERRAGRGGWPGRGSSPIRG